MLFYHLLGAVKLLGPGLRKFESGRGIYNNMKHIKLFEEFINKTLGSDTRDIAIKKLDIFFTRKGLNKKPIVLNSDVASPYYQIITDKERYREMLIDSVKRYKERINDPEISPESKALYVDQIQDKERILNEFDFKSYDTIVINTDFNSKEMSLELMALIDSVGYHIVSIGTWGTHLQNRPQEYDPKESLLSSDRIRLLVIQPNYGERVEFRGEYLYHTTDSKYLDKILKYGLVPKSKNNRFFYPGRIFLTPSKEFSDVLKLELIRQKSNFNYEKEKLAWKSSVDLRIKNFKGLTLYRDMMLPAKHSLDFPEGGFFTYDNIPPEYIEVVPNSSEEYPL